MFLKTFTQLFSTNSNHRKASAKSSRRNKELRSKLRTLRLENLESRELMAVVSHGSPVMTDAANPVALVSQESIVNGPITTPAGHTGASLVGAEMTGTTSKSTTTTVAPPADPTMTATAVSSSQINLAWNKVSGTSNYLVDEWVNNAWKQIASDGNYSTSTKITGLTANTTYYFDVAASNSGGASWANFEGATTFQTPPAAPSVTATAVSASQINLSWKSISNASGYLVNEQINGTWKQIDSLGSSATSVSITGLNANTSYKFEVAAFNSAATTWSSSHSATTLKAPPGAPTFTATAASQSQINLAWNSVSGASNYLVDEWVNSAWKQIGSFGSSTTSDKVTGLSAGTTYQFQVAAVNSTGTTWATAQSVTTTAAPITITVDHPTADTTYSPVSGSLFGANGPVFTDVHQGEAGDCWLLSSLAAVAARDPNDIRNMFTAAGTTVENGATVSLYTVRFFNSAGVAQTVTVDTELPSGGDYYDQPANGVLWVALAEKAYAEANGQGIVTTQYEGSDSYDALNGGSPTWALQAITGKSAGFYSINPTNIASAWNAGDIIVIDSSPNANDNLIVGDSEGTHAYAVVNYVASSSSPFEVYNPWGMSSTVGGTISYNGSQVYGGAFYANATLIAQDFVEQDFGTGVVAPLNVHGNAAAVAGNAHVNATTAGMDAVKSNVTPTVLTTKTINSLSTSPANASSSALDELFAKWNGDEFRPEITLPVHV